MVSIMIPTALIMFVVLFQSPPSTTARPAPTLQKKFIQEVLQEMEMPDKDLRQLDSKEMKLFVIVANKNYEILKTKMDAVQREKDALAQEAEDERSLRFVYQALMDLTESIERLFVSCWPGWAGTRTKSNHSPDAWKTVLLNVENLSIAKLKKTLKFLKIEDEDFIKAMCDLEIDRNAEAHRGLLAHKKNTGYGYLKDILTVESQKKSLKAFLIAISTVVTFKNPESIKISQQEDEQLSAEVKESIDEDRKLLKLIRISNVPDITEEARLKTKFEAIVEKCKKKLNAGKKCSGPVAVWINRQTHFGYILFDSFQSAYFTWINRKNLEFSTNVYDSMKIINAIEPLWNITLNMFVKIQTSKIKTQMQLLNIVQVGEIEADSMFQDVSNTALFLGYDTLEKLLLNYQKCARLPKVLNYQTIPKTCIHFYVQV